MMAAESSLLIPDYPLTVLPNLAVQIGLNEAIFLQQVRYWIGQEAGFCDQYGRRWIYNTIKQWRVQFPFWSESTIKRTIRSLEEQNVLLSTTVGDAFNKTKAYTINFDRIEELAEEIVHEQRRTSIESVQRRVSAPPPKRIGIEYSEESTGFDESEIEDIPSAITKDNLEGQNIKVDEPLDEVKLTQREGHFDLSDQTILTPSNRPLEKPETTRVYEPSSRARETETTTTENTQKELKTTTSDIRAFCASLGVPSLSTEKFIQRYGENLVQEKARLLETAMQTQSIRNPAGWLNTALKNGYTFSPGNSQRESVPEQKDPPRPYVPPASVSVPTTRKTTVKRDVQEVLSLQAGEGSEFAKEFLRRKNADGRASP